MKKSPCNTTCAQSALRRKGGGSVIILGLILLIVGFLFKIAILWTIGIILLIIGAILWLMGSTGRAIGGRRHYW
jgi:Family of unknown function (DUF6131)